jgi:hypothetical protein
MRRKSGKPPQADKVSPPPSVQDEPDFYWEGSRMVFTEAFLRRRGFCCQSGCRHCPYGFGPEGLKRKLAAEAAQE